MKREQKEQEIVVSKVFRQCSLEEFRLRAVTRKEGTAVQANPISGLNTRRCSPTRTINGSYSRWTAVPSFRVTARRRNSSSEHCLNTFETTISCSFCSLFISGLL